MKNILLGAFLLSTAVAAQAQKLPGTADSSFNSNGFKKVNYGDQTSLVSSAYLDNNGKLVMVGSSMNAQFKWSIGMARLNTNGTLDVSFKNNGTSIIDVDPANSEGINDVFLSGSGILWGAGNMAGPNGTDMVLIKADQDGVLDVSFANSGFFSLEVSTGYELATHVIEDKNGKVLVLGNAPVGLAKMFLVRVNPNGTIDSSFGGDGIVLLDPLNENNTPVALMERPQGGYYVVSTTTGNGSTKVSIVSVSQNGNYNIDLGGPGEIQFQYQNLPTRASAAAYHNGSIYIAGDFDGPNGNSDGYITRMETDGTINMTFNQTGFNRILTTLANTADEFVKDMVIAEDSSIFVSTISFQDSNMVIISRFQPDGNVNGSFGNNNGRHHVYLPESGYPNFAITALLLDHTAKRLYIMGDPNDGAGDFMYAYAVYTGEFATPNNTGLNSAINTLAIFPNPSSGTISIAKELSGDERLLLLDMQGRIVMNEATSNTVTLKEELKNGVYFLKLISNNETYTAKVVLNR
ncbi:MAG: T9SS type A sorting domain-containing protein [Bacteroidia bacterium]